LKRIQNLLNTLASFPHSNIIGNPYVEQYAVENLRHYFEYVLSQKGKRILLVGEAPGYKGCRITGIPFTSGRVFHEIPHPMLLALKDKIHLPSLEAENTATMVWSILANNLARKPLGEKVTPLLWNAFPFHPHPIGQVNKNRAPNSEEILFGSEILYEVHQIFKPDLVAGIGHKGVIALQQLFPNDRVQYIRHPSYGGKELFIEGINRLI